MPRLIHLNGPPGIGKSTLARMYVEDHPGVLNLDVDQVRCLIGGWREEFERTGDLVRPVALAMARTHLRGGHDVVFPQYLGRLDEIERFEAAAHDSDADFCEVVLMDGKERSLDRFDRRGEGQDLPWHDHVRELVERRGGRAFLADMYDHLTEVVRSRPASVVVSSEPGAVRDAYEAFRSVVGSMP